ncbi:MAG: septal ring lytic transglycosylase RlpA family protein [Flavisolibacter sp.]|jgi:rare lipoprotein A
MRYAFLCIAILFLFKVPKAQLVLAKTDSVATRSYKTSRVMYGTASYYADKFNGRETANGEVYDSKKMTAACNVLPMGSWIKVTNLTNNRSVIVRTNDRLHIRMTRIVDLSRSAAEKLGYIGKGLTHVKVEVLERK